MGPSFLWLLRENAPFHSPFTTGKGIRRTYFHFKPQDPMGEQYFKKFFVVLKYFTGQGLLQTTDHCFFGKTANFQLFPLKPWFLLIFSNSLGLPWLFMCMREFSHPKRLQFREWEVSYFFYFYFNQCVTLTLEIWLLVKVMTHHWVMDNNCVKYYPDWTIKAVRSYGTETM